MSCVIADAHSEHDILHARIAYLGSHWRFHFPLRFVMEAIKWKIHFDESECIDETLSEYRKCFNIWWHKIWITTVRTNYFILMKIYVTATRSTQRIHNHSFPSDTIFEIETIYASTVIITSKLVSSDLVFIIMIDTHMCTFYPNAISNVDHLLVHTRTSDHRRYDIIQNEGKTVFSRRYTCIPDWAFCLYFIV